MLSFYHELWPSSFWLYVTNQWQPLEHCSLILKKKKSFSKTELRKLYGILSGSQKSLRIQDGDGMFWCARDLWQLKPRGRWTFPRGRNPTRAMGWMTRALGHCHYHELSHPLAPVPKTTTHPRDSPTIGWPRTRTRGCILTGAAHCTLYPGHKHLFAPSTCTLSLISFFKIHPKEHSHRS